MSEFCPNQALLCFPGGFAWAAGVCMANKPATTRKRPVEQYDHE